MIFDLERRTSRKAVAVHEAGHLFVSLATPPTPAIKAIWIKSVRGRWEGMVEAVIPRVETTPAIADRQILVALAGPLAEIRWRMRSRWGALFTGEANSKIALEMGYDAGADFGQVAELIHWRGDADPHAAFMEAWFASEAILHANWQRILTLADRLKVCERIEGGELHALPFRILEPGSQ